MFDIKAIYEARDVEDAIRLRIEHPAAQILAGGSDVLVQIREGRRAGAELISIFGIDSLRGVSEEADGTLRIGSLTSFSHIERDPTARMRVKVLCDAVGTVGGPQIRNIGTIGGNTCNGVTSADSASTLFALDALVELRGKDGVRILPVEKFYLKAGVVDVRQDEIQTAILIPKPSWEGFFGHYEKYSMRNAMDIATLGCSVNVRLSSDKKTIDCARIAFGVAGPIPLRCRNAEAFAKGMPATFETCTAAGEKILDDINPRDSWRASKAFRSHIGQVMASRCLQKALEEALSH